MITSDDYFGPRLGHPEITPEIQVHAQFLLEKVNALLEWAAKYGGYHWWVDPDTGTCVSGTYNPNLPKHHSGDGGWRSSDSKTGGPGSKHRIARAVDVYDPNNVLDNLLSDEILELFGLYRETPKATQGWCHLQDIAPSSGKRTYDI